MNGSRLPLRRLLAFGSVSALGFGVQLATLLVLVGWFDVNYLLGTVFAVELAILHNFSWHQRYTWSDRGTGSARLMVERLLRFNAGTAATSIAGNVLLMWTFVSALGMHYALANVLAMLSLSVVNFLFSDRLVFRAGDQLVSRSS